MSASPTTFPPEVTTIPTREELEQLAEVLVDVVGDVDALAAGLERFLGRNLADGAAAIRAKLPADVLDATLGAIDARVPHVDADTAWHLHYFVLDVRSLGENLVKFASRIDEATLALYGYTADVEAAAARAVA